MGRLWPVDFLLQSPDVGNIESSVSVLLSFISLSSTDTCIYILLFISRDCRDSQSCSAVFVSLPAQAQSLFLPGFVFFCHRGAQTARDMRRVEKSLRWIRILAFSVVFKAAAAAGRRSEIHTQMKIIYR